MERELKNSFVKIKMKILIFIHEIKLFSITTYFICVSISKMIHKIKFLFYLSVTWCNNYN